MGKGRELLCYPQCTDLAVRALSIGGDRQTLTVEKWTQRERGGTDTEMIERMMEWDWR